MFYKNNGINICDNKKRFNTWHQLGLFQAEKGDLEGAIRSISRGIAFFDQSAQAFHDLAFCYLQKKEHAHAIKWATQALQLQPEYFNTWLILGSAQLCLEMLDEALISLDHALKLDLNHVETLYKIGIVLAKKNNHSVAIQYYKKALTLDKNNAEVFSDLAASLALLGRHQEALDANEQALALNSNLKLALINKGAILARLGRYEEAIESHRKMMAIDPENPIHGNGLGFALMHILRNREAVELYQNLIERHPNFLLLKCNLGYLLLRLGDFKRGLPLFEYRMSVPEFSRREKLETPQWLGEKIDGKTLLIRWEQGFGDTIQFLRYIPYLSHLNCKLIIDLQLELHCLFNHLGIPLTCSKWATPQHDVHVNLMSLPYLFKTDLSSIPPPISLGNAHYHPIRNRVGIAWKGNPQDKRHRRRSLDLKLLEPLLQMAEVDYVCLQKDITQEEANLLDAHGVDLPQLDSFTDTLHVLEKCEYVICAETVIVNLAGSMGIPTWVLVPYMPDWRWMLGRTDSPWYPSVRLFRQTVIDSWVEPIEEMTNLLNC